ncbi:hypothetical protein CIHG_04521 [Coccidioides immitis H538.4]|uniref:Uncharacterized protein n=1 Tax=Coccidioides immitis H538.4 TaxID=396776 RepID=A0A0J8RQ31_COCIT|nr:hypothetical protein CIHG_04521 [Coccidioides immitis H538.4]
MSGPCDEMAEKRKLRAPPTTRTRKSDATTPQRQVPAKRKASATPAPKLPEAVEEEPLPTKIKEGNPLPTLAKRCGRCRSSTVADKMAPRVYFRKILDKAVQKERPAAARNSKSSEGIHDQIGPVYNCD